MNNEDAVLEFNYKNPLRERMINELRQAVPSTGRVKDIVQGAMQRTFNSYMDNIAAYVANSKIKNPYIGEEEQPDEKLMRSIEKNAGIGEAQVDDYRRQIMSHAGSVAVMGKKWQLDSNPKLHKAIEQTTMDKITKSANKILDKKK